MTRIGRIRRIFLIHFIPPIRVQFVWGVASLLLTLGACRADEQTVTLPTTAAIAASVSATASSTVGALREAPLQPTMTLAVPASITPSASPTLDTPQPTLHIATPPPTATYTPQPTLNTPQPYLSRHTLVSFYGSAEGAGMGILNFRETPQLLLELRERAAEYQALLPEKEALPTFHIIVTIADPWFGEDDNFNHRASLESIEQWLALAEAEGMGVVLDIQPGHAPVQEEFERIRPYLYNPNVHLALDSEYTMERTPSGLYEIPGEVLGSLYAAQINPIQAQLEEIALEIGVNKVLIVHQFEDEMMPDKQNIVDYEHVELVIDADGFGGPDKVRDYNKYAAEPGFEYGGFKLYRNFDNPLLTPEQVMGLEPSPAVVIYQ